MPRCHNACPGRSETYHNGPCTLSIGAFAISVTGPATVHTISPRHRRWTIRGADYECGYCPRQSAQTTVMSPPPICMSMSCGTIKFAGRQLGYPPVDQTGPPYLPSVYGRRFGCQLGFPYQITSHCVGRRDTPIPTLSAKRHRCLPSHRSL